MRTIDKFHIQQSLTSAVLDFKVLRYLVFRKGLDFFREAGSENAGSAGRNPFLKRKKRVE